MVGELVPDFCHQHLPFPVTTSSLSSWVRVEGVPQGPWGLSSRLPLRVHRPPPWACARLTRGFGAADRAGAGGTRAGAGAGEGAPRAGALARDPAPAAGQVQRAARTHRCAGRTPSGGTWWRRGGGAGVGARPAAAARGRLGVSAAAPSPAFIGSRQLGAGGGRPGRGRADLRREVRAEVRSRAGRAGRGQRPAGCARRAGSVSRGRARGPGRHRLRAPVARGGGASARTSLRARSPVAAPTLWPRPRASLPAHCDRISGPGPAPASPPRRHPGFPPRRPASSLRAVTLGQTGGGGGSVRRARAPRWPAAEGGREARERTDARARGTVSQEPPAPPWPGRRPHSHGAREALGEPLFRLGAMRFLRVLAFSP